MGEKGDKTVASLLSEDYRYLADSFWKNEQSGETRVNLFIGIVTLVVGALATLVAADNHAGFSPAQLRVLISASMLGLLTIGVTTLLRMLIRNKATDRYKAGLDTIRQVMKDQSEGTDALQGYYPISLPDVQKDKYLKKAQSKESQEETFLRQARKQGAELRRYGGLAHTVSAINGLLVAVLVGVSLFTPGTDVLTVEFLAPTVLSFPIVLALQIAYIAKREHGTKKSIRAGRPTHAFGVVHKDRDGEINYLLVRPKKWKKGDNEEWVLPKGHIEEGECHGEAAIREVREEAGIVTYNPTFIIGNIEFVIPNEDTDHEWVNAKAYLLSFLYNAEDHKNEHEEVRPVLWAPFEKAKTELKHPESQIILELADGKRRSMDRGLRSP